MYITILVRLDVVLTLRKQQTLTRESEELLQAAKELGVKLKPMHPGVEDPHLVPYYMVEVADISRAEQVMDRFLKCKAVEGAYIKPPDELP
jgi:hypothetical protein